MFHGDQIIASQLLGDLYFALKRYDDASLALYQARHAGIGGFGQPKSEKDFPALLKDKLLKLEALNEIKKKVELFLL